MVVLVLTACPAGLRGHLTRWLLEVSAGVFVGKVSARVRGEIWAHVVESLKDGRALMVFQTDAEQGYDFVAHKHHWDVIDLDGLKLIKRPTQETDSWSMRPGWSSAAKRRRYSRRK